MNEQPITLRRTVATVAVLNLAYFGVEFAVAEAIGSVSLFADSFYFGCEADDRGLVTAFLPSNPEGRDLRPVFSSDMGHWDVTDIAGVVAESHHLVERGHLTAEQWRRFVFDNPAEMFLRADHRGLRR